MSSEREKLILEGVKELGYVLAPFLSDLPPFVDKNDLISESLVSIVEAADRFDPDLEGGALFKTYVNPKLRGSIMNYLSRFVRASRAKIEVDIDHYSRNGGASAFGDGGSQVRGILRCSRLSKLLECLNEEERILIELHFYRDQTHRQIASGADMEPSTVTRGIHRALKKMREIECLK